MTSQLLTDTQIAEAFALEAGETVPPEQWVQIRQALAASVEPAVETGLPVTLAPGGRGDLSRRPVLRQVVAAAALLAAVTLSTLLYPPIRASAARAIGNLARLIWQGDVSGTPARVIQNEPVPEEVLQDLPVTPLDPARPADFTTVSGSVLSSIPPEDVVMAEQEVGSVAEAEALLGFSLPAVHASEAVLKHISVHTLRFKTDQATAEQRIADLRYEWDLRQYVMLTVSAGFLQQGQGEFVAQPQTKLTMLLQEHEPGETPYKVNLGTTEALCAKRRQAGTELHTECDWLQDVRVIRISGADQQSVIDFARSIVAP